MVLDEVAGQGLEIEKRMLSTKPWDLPTLRAWEHGTAASRGVQEGKRVGVEETQEEGVLGKPNATSLFFSLCIYKGRKSTCLNSDLNVL